MQNPTTGVGSLAPPQTTAGNTQNPTTGVGILAPPQTTAGNVQSNTEGTKNTSTQAAAKSTEKPKFTCVDCDFTCHSFQNFRIHVQTADCKNKKDSEKTNTDNAAAEPEESEDISAHLKVLEENAAKLKDLGENAARLRDFISKAEREPLIGLEYVTAYCLKTKEDQIKLKYFCELCEHDADVEPMVEHLSGMDHQMVYMAKDYPYVLDAQAKSKEDPPKYIRRMAVEIEKAEGTKTHKIDTSIHTETMALGAAKKKLKEKSRFTENKNDPTKMEDVLKVLDTFEIEDEAEAANITRLRIKMIANMNCFVAKAKEIELFRARVAKAQDVAKSLTQIVAARPAMLKKIMTKGKIKIAPLANIELPTAPPAQTTAPPAQTTAPPANVNLINAAGVPSGFLGTNFPNINAIPNIPLVPPFPLLQQYPTVPLIPAPSMPEIKETPQTEEDPILKDITQEDTQFFKKLMALLEALPQEDSSSETTEMNAKLLMLKSLLVKEKNEVHEQANQKMMAQIASLVQNTLSVSQNQQLIMLMASRNRAAMAMQAGNLVPGIQGLGAMPTNVNPLMPFNQSFGGQTFGQMEGNTSTPMDQNAYQVPMQSYPGTSQNFPGTSQNFPGTSQNFPGTSQNFPGTSQNYDNFAYGNPGAVNYLPPGNSFIGQQGGIDNSRTSSQENIPYTDVGHESSAGNKDWDEYYGNSSRAADHTETAYTGMCVSPSSLRNQYDYNEDRRGEIRTQKPKFRPSLRPYDSFDEDDLEGDMRYNKHPRLDMDDASNRFHESIGINTEAMSRELIKRLKGKDFFLPPPINNEYSEKRSGK